MRRIIPQPCLGHLLFLCLMFALHNSIFSWNTCVSGAETGHNAASTNVQMPIPYAANVYVPTGVESIPSRYYPYGRRGANFVRGTLSGPIRSYEKPKDWEEIKHRFAMRQAREGSIQEGPLLGPYGFNYNHQVIQNFVPTFSISVKPNAAAVAAQEKDPIGQIEAEMNGVVRQKGGSSMAGSTAGPSSSSSDSASASESSQGRTLADYNMTPEPGTDVHEVYRKIGASQLPYFNPWSPRAQHRTHPFPDYVKISTSGKSEASSNAGGSSA